MSPTGCAVAVVGRTGGMVSRLGIQVWTCEAIGNFYGGLDMAALSPKKQKLHRIYHHAIICGGESSCAISDFDSEELRNRMITGGYTLCSECFPGDRGPTRPRPEAGQIYETIKGIFVRLAVVMEFASGGYALLTEELDSTGKWVFGPPLLPSNRYTFETEDSSVYYVSSLSEITWGTAASWSFSPIKDHTQRNEEGDVQLSVDTTRLAQGLRECTGVGVTILSELPKHQPGPDERTCRLCRKRKAFKTRPYCSVCQKKVLRPTAYPDDVSRDVGAVSSLIPLAYLGKSYVRLANGQKLKAMKECAIHGVDGCLCQPPRLFGDQQEAQAPFYVPYPEFAMGIELEIVAPASTIQAIKGLIPMGADGTIEVEGMGAARNIDARTSNWLTGECRIPTTSGRAAIHAARAAYWIRRLGGHVNRSCGMHVHVDRRLLPDEKQVTAKLLDLWIGRQDWAYSMFPSRKHNTYCRPITAIEDSAGHNHPSHYAVLNRSPLQTFEVRLSPSTTNFFHAYAWTHFVEWLYRRAIYNADKQTPKPDFNLPDCVEALYRIRTSDLSTVDFATFCYSVLRREKFKKKDLSASLQSAVDNITAYVLSAKELKCAA